MIRAVVFDLDGVLLDSEGLWDAARRDVVARSGGMWRDEATEAMLGMSSLEWSAYLHDVLGVDLAPEQIVELVVEDLLARYRRELPLVPGARDAVERIGARWPLALATSSNPVVIETVLEVAGLSDAFEATVSSEEVPRGKPHPDVYLEATHRLGRDPADCAAIEDSGNGIRSALAAGLRVVAVPNIHFPPPQEVLARADAVTGDLSGLTVELVERVGHPGADEDLDEAEVESFPASDPHSDWAGPAR